MLDCAECAAKHLCQMCIYSPISFGNVLAQLLLLKRDNFVLKSLVTC